MSVLPSESLIDDICAADPATVAAALRAVTPHREALAPVLLARLLQTTVEPKRWTGDKGQPSPVFLAYVAAAWRLTDAHPLLVALLRLPPDDCEAVLGDFITEGAKLTLADTWPGDLRAIEALALDGEAESYARGAALDAAALLCARNVVPRDTVMSLLSRCAALPLDPEVEAEADFAGQIVSTVLDLRAWELRGSVTTLFERELVDPSFCGDLDEVLDELEPGTVFNPNSHHFPPPITDAWEAVRGWHFFDELHPGKRRWVPPAPAAGESTVFPSPVPLPPAENEPWQPAQPYHAPPKTGRNDPCPCGSGKKFKRCCGA